MSTIYLPGLTGEVTRYLNDQAPRPSPRMAAGGAIALLGSIVNVGWELPAIGLYPDDVLDRVLQNRPGEDFPRTQRIGQNVVLVADNGCGKGGIIEGVEQLLASMETAYPTTSAIRQRLVTIESLNHLALAGLEPEAEGVQRMRRLVRPQTLERLSNGLAVLLAESTPEAFEQALPFWYGSSTFYGDCLMMQHRGGRKPRNRQPQARPSAALLRRLALLADLALGQDEQKVLIEVSAEATEWYRQFLNWDMDLYCDHGPVGMEGQWGRFALRVAGIVAATLEPLRPVVTAELFRQATDFVADGVRLARSGLRPARAEG